MRVMILGTLILAVVAGFGCGDDEATGSDSEPNLIYDSLLFVRGGGGVMTTGADWAICCGVWESGYIEDNTLKIMIYDALDQESGFKLFILVDSVETGFSYGLPTDEPGSSPVSLFINDIGAGSNSQEFNSTVAGSSGSITINELSCGPPVVLDVTIDATIGSETFGIQPITLSGRFVCEVHTNPDINGCDFSF